MSINDSGKFNFAQPAYFPVNKGNILKLTGSDAKDLLHRISASRVQNAGNLELTRLFFLNEKGRVVDFSLFFQDGSNIYLIGVNPDPLEVENWLDKYIIMEDVQVSALPKAGLIEIYGPEPEKFRSLLADKGKAAKTDFGGKPAFVFRDNIKQCLTLFAPDADNEFLQEQAAKLAPGINGISPDEYETQRIANGIPSANELNLKYNPHETGLIDSVDFAKGCYIGQEVIARLDTYDKVQKYLRGLKFDADPGFKPPFTLYDGEDEAGTVTSSIYDRDKKIFIGLGYVRKKFDSPDTVLSAKGSKSEIKISEFPLL